MKRLLTFVVICGISITAISQKITLKYNFKEGSTYNLNQEVESIISQEIQGNVIEINLSMKTATSYTVTKASSDQFEIEILYKDLAMKMNTGSMGANLEYDSKTTEFDSTNIAHTALSSMLGEKFYCTINTLGKVISVSGFENIIQKLHKNMNGDSTKTQMAKEILTQSFSDESIKASLETSFRLFPETAVSIGDSWVIQTKTITGMEMNFENRVTLKDATAKNWILESSSTIATSDLEMKKNGMDIKFAMAGKAKSSFVLDAKTGWINNATSLLNLDGDMEVSGEQLPTPMEIPMKMEINSTTNSL